MILVPLSFGSDLDPIHDPHPDPTPSLNPDLDPGLDLDPDLDLEGVPVNLDHLHPRSPLH